MKLQKEIKKKEVNIIFKNGIKFNIIEILKKLNHHSKDINGT